MNKREALAFMSVFSASGAVLTGCSPHLQTHVNNQIATQHWAKQNPDMAKDLRAELGEVVTANHIGADRFKVQVDPANDAPLYNVDRSNNVYHVTLNHAVEHPPFTASDRKALLAVAINDTLHPVVKASYPAALKQAVQDQYAYKTDMGKIPAAAADEASHNVGLANAKAQLQQDQASARMLGADGVENLKHMLMAAGVEAKRDHQPTQSPDFAARIQALSAPVSAKNGPAR